MLQLQPQLMNPVQTHVKNLTLLSIIVLKLTHSSMCFTDQDKNRFLNRTEMDINQSKKQFVNFS